jgi:hypothetical protein
VRLDGRLRRLEESASASKGWRVPRYLDAYFRALENLERKEAGLPSLPYTEEDRKDDEEFLRETLPFYRANLRWQTEEAQGVLDKWEKHTRSLVAGGASRKGREGTFP